MKVDSTEFGSITIDGTTYPHDVLIRLSGEIKKRKKRLSCLNDSVRLSPEAAEFFTRKHCEVLDEPTPQALAAFNRAKGRKIGLFHVTC